jgi:hypothetical protein
MVCVLVIVGNCLENPAKYSFASLAMGSMMQFLLPKSAEIS